MLVVVVAVGAVVCAGITYSKFDNYVGLRAIGYGAAFAFIPVVPTCLVAGWLNRLRPEPLAALVICLLWGAFIATYFALELNQYFAGKVHDPAGATSRSAVFVAPWVEETVKAAIVFVVVLWRRHDFGGVTAGAICGALAGIGFAFVENILYFAADYQGALNSKGGRSLAWDSMLQLARQRDIATPFAHPLFTMMTGIGIGVAVRVHHIGTRIIAPAAGFSVAALLHMSYNAGAGAANNHDSLLGSYLLLFVPAVLLGAAFVLVVRRRENDVLSARLHDYAAFGWIKSEQVPYVVELPRRRIARRYARRLGKAEVRRVREFQRTGLELAVLRDRMVRGVVDERGLDRERALIERMRTLRQLITLPPEAGPKELAAATESSW